MAASNRLIVGAPLSPRGACRPASTRKPIMDDQDSPRTLRSARWFGPADLRSFGHRSRAMQMGYSPEEWTGQACDRDRQHLVGPAALPCATSSTRVEDVKRGVLMAGGFPVELPALSVSESFVKPTSDDVPQHAGDGDGGAAALPPDRRRGADGRVATRRRPGCCWAPPAWTCPVDLPAGRADAAGQLGRARRWARAATAGNTGTSCGRARSPTRTGWAWRAASPAAMARA